MKEVFQCFSDGKFYTISELEKHLNFNFLHRIAFETPSEKEDIKERRLDKLKNNGVSQENLS